MLKKRGLSPVVATMLLITLALILAVIIFLWARSFIGESVQKQGADVEQSCQEVYFEVQAFASSGIDIVNQGTIPIYAMEVRKSALLGDSAGVENLNGDTSIGIGQSAHINFPENMIVNAGETLELTPVLLGQLENGETKTHVCSSSYTQEVEIQ